MNELKKRFTPIRHGDWRKRNGVFVDVSAAPAALPEAKAETADPAPATKPAARKRTRNSKRK